ncbi:MAG: hypothetical protein JST01_22440 [Cyanobacteria bacterium SZAS TMP-1]|nr:hypothetical protein [Cyanobacteria bacterium SZAS TMP-1]
MSFSVTMLLLTLCFFSTKNSARYVTCSYGAFKIAMLGSFCVSTAVPLLVDFHNPNEGKAFLLGFVGALLLPPILLLLCRGFKLFVRAVQRQVNKTLFSMGRGPWVITWI